MAESGAIRAGKAFVEAYLDRTRLTRDLATVQRQLQSFGLGVTAMGRRLMIVGGAILTPLLAATRQFMVIGDTLHDMSRRTGLSTNALSELGYAAEQSGSSIETLEKNIKLMQKIIRKGIFGDEAKELRRLGISVSDLKRMNAEQQFEAIAGAIAAIPDATIRAATALSIFGRSGASILPMLEGGVAGIRELRQEAIRLGLSIGPEQAAMADALSDSWKTIKRTFGAVSVAIGTALAPMLQSLAQRIIEGRIATRQWVDENRNAIVAVFNIGLAALGAGAGLYVLGKAIVVLSGLLKIGTVLANIFTASMVFLQVTLGVLTHPIALVAAGLIGLGAYFLYSSGMADRAVTYIGSALADLWQEASETFSTIAESMAAGDFVSAAKVGWAFIKLEWTKGVNFLEGLWDSFVGVWQDTAWGLAIVFTNIVAKVKTLWAEMLGWMQKQFEAFSVSGFTEILANLLAPVFAGLYGVSADEMTQTLKEDFARGRERLGSTQGQIDSDTAARIAEIEEGRRGTVSGLEGDIARRSKEREERRKAAEDDVARARAELEAARQEAAAKSAGRRTIAGGMPFPEMELPEIGMAKDAKTRGTFSGFAVAGLGIGGGPMKGVEKKLDQLIKIDRDLLIEQKAMTLEMTA